MGRRKGSKNKPKVPLSDVVTTKEPVIFNSSTPIVANEPKKRGRKPKPKNTDINIDENLISKSTQKEDEQSIGDNSKIKINPENGHYLNNDEPQKELSLEDSGDSENSEKEITVGLEEQKVLETSTQPVTVLKVSKKRGSTKTYPFCDCCHKEIYSQPHRIDTNILSAQVADYHRESPRWVELCTECAHALSDVIDNWLQEHGCLNKFNTEIPKEEVTVEDDFQF